MRCIFEGDFGVRRLLRMRCSGWSRGDCHVRRDGGQPPSDSTITLSGYDFSKTGVMLFQIVEPLLRVVPRLNYDGLLRLPRRLQGTKKRLGDSQCDAFLKVMMVCGA